MQAAMTLRGKFIALMVGISLLTTVGVGAVFPTTSKDDAAEVSYDTLKAICEAVSIPVVAIGGITQENVVKLTGSGIDGVAVISAIYAQKDIKKAAADLKAAVKAIV